METVCHIEIDKDLELGCFGELVRNHWDGVLGNGNELINSAVVTTEADKRCSCFRSNNQG